MAARDANVGRHVSTRDFRRIWQNNSKSGLQWALAILPGAHFNIRDFKKMSLPKIREDSFYTFILDLPFKGRRPPWLSDINSQRKPEQRC